VRPQPAQEGVRFGQVFAGGVVALEQVRHGVEPQPVDAHGEPEIQDLEDGLADRRVVEIQIRLVRIEAVPVVGAGDRIPGPVRGLEVLEDDAHVAELLWVVTPDVEIAIFAALGAVPGALEPLVRARGVVDDELGDDANVAGVRLAQQTLEIREGAVHRVYGRVVGDVVATVAQRGRIERQEPDRIDAQVLDVVELGD
jgi:hypothetical protein